MPSSGRSSRLVVLSLVLFAAPALAGSIRYAGVRSSNYGISPFPSPGGWQNAMQTMAGYFPGSTPVGIWIVGPLGSNGGCRLEFPHPGDGVNYGTRIQFSTSDKHEPYLDHFDAHGIKVFLQVEPGFADMPTLIDLVLKRYRHHPSVIGFGVDVEWYQNATTGGANAKVTDAVAQQWEARVKSYNSSYRLFIKHFAPGDLAPTYRGDVIFVNDSQNFPDKASFLAEFKVWADFFHPAMVMYQIGYSTDKPWWSVQPRPIPQSLGNELAAQTQQDCGIAWVDFTLRDVLPTSEPRPTPRVTPTPTPTPTATPTPTPTPTPLPPGTDEVTPGGSGVTASTHDGNVPANTVDNSLATRWSANGDGQWIKYDIGQAVNLAFVKIAVYNGNARRNRFDLQVSSDNVSWTNVLTGALTSGTTTQEVTYDFADTTARWVRYVGHGSTVGTYNSVTEVSLFAGGGTPEPPTPTPTPAATPTPTATPAVTPTPTPTPAADAEVPLAASAVTASTSDGNLPANTIDNNLATRWSANGDGQWIRFDLGAAHPVTRVRIAFYNGNLRRSRFDLQYSNDNVAWTNLLAGALSSGTTTLEQEFDVADTQARWIRYLGHGNTINAWNSLTEVSLYAFPAVP